MRHIHLKQSSEVSNELYSLACGPDARIHTYTGCIVNGVCFHTKYRDNHRMTQNSGICVFGEHDGEDVNFSGVLTNVVELDYLFGHKVILFKCKWFDTNHKNKKIHQDPHFTVKNISSTWYENDPFVLATQARQVFYLDDYKNGQNWKVVQKVQHRHMWDILEVDNTIEVDRNFDETIEDDAYQENESCGIEWSIGLDDQLGLQCFDRTNVNPEVINNNNFSMGDRNDDDFICDDIIEEDFSDDSTNNVEEWLSCESESD